MSWWANKLRQFRAHVRARVSATERAEIAAWVAPAQLGLFDSMHVADQRHGLDVMATLRRQGVTDSEVLLAGLLHDAGKGREAGLLPRVAWSLGELYGRWVWSVAALFPVYGRALERLRTHAERSARLAAAAGCSLRTVELIRNQSEPSDREYGELLRLADEAN